MKISLHPLGNSALASYRLLALEYWVRFPTITKGIIEAPKGIIEDDHPKTMIIFGKNPKMITKGIKYHRNDPLRGSQSVK